MTPPPVRMQSMHFTHSKQLATPCCAHRLHFAEPGLAMVDALVAALEATGGARSSRSSYTGGGATSGSMRKHAPPKAQPSWKIDMRSMTGGLLDQGVPNPCKAQNNPGGEKGSSGGPVAGARISCGSGDYGGAVCAAPAGEAGPGAKSDAQLQAQHHTGAGLGPSPSPLLPASSQRGTLHLLG